MATYTQFNFSDSGLNYTTVETELLRLYSDVSADLGTRHPLELPMDIINAQMINRLYDKTAYPEKWKKDLAIAYQLLYNYYA
jgi:hypothetical protein